MLSSHSKIPDNKHPVHNTLPKFLPDPLGSAFQALPAAWGGLPCQEHRVTSPKIQQCHTHLIPNFHQQPSPCSRERPSCPWLLWNSRGWVMPKVTHRGWHTLLGHREVTLGGHPVPTPQTAQQGLIPEPAMGNVGWAGCGGGEMGELQPAGYKSPPFPLKFRPCSFPEDHQAAEIIPLL